MSNNLADEFDGLNPFGQRSNAGNDTIEPAINTNVTHRSKSSSRRQPRESLLTRLQTTAENAGIGVGEIQDWIAKSSDVINKEFDRNTKDFTQLKTDMSEIKALLQA